MAEIIKTMGIVLNSEKYTTDGARNLTIFSVDKGKIKAVIKGVEKPKAKLAVASQPFCFGEFSLAQRGAFFTVVDCFVEDSFFSLAYNLDTYVLGSSLLEITGKVVQSGEKNVEVFTLLLKALKSLAYDKSEPTAVTIKFIISLLKVSGFGFDLEKCEVCKKQLLSEEKIGIVYTGSGAVCKKHMAQNKSVELTLEEWETFKNIISNDLENLKKEMFVSRDAITSCLKLVLKQFYYRTGEKIDCLAKYL